jgi:hypothetical protein
VTFLDTPRLDTLFDLRLAKPDGSLLPIPELEARKTAALEPVEHCRRRQTEELGDLASS